MADAYGFVLEDRVLVASSPNGVLMVNAPNKPGTRVPLRISAGAVEYAEDLQRSLTDLIDLLTCRDTPPSVIEAAVNNARGLVHTVEESCKQQ